jgi:hypothetical protein
MAGCEFYAARNIVGGHGDFFASGSVAEIVGLSVVTGEGTVHMVSV